MVAEHLGMTHREFRTRVRSDEFLEWLAFFDWRREEQEWARKKAEL